MKEKNRFQKEAKTKEKREDSRGMIHSFAVISGCALLSMGIVIGSKFLESDEKNRVYAASEMKGGTLFPEKLGKLPTGIAGVVTGVSETPAAGTRVARIGTSCENVMVGQRISIIESGTSRLNVSSSMASTVERLDQKVVELAGSPKLMSDGDYDNLLRIVEAEAGTEDVKGRILVANVVMNRVKDERFPDTVTEVVWEQNLGVAQFSPTYDGRIYQVTVSESTKDAVRQALEGVDYSQGALFFVEKAAADKSGVAWFEKDLKRLFKYGVHEFYTYPEGSKDKKDKEEMPGSGKTKEEGAIVQMVKKD